ncbi:hypothetical protein RRG08_060719 [Elysia crispata]|uniref:Uncharacterized protein n=1 Tax=Elysia crispata TaxID=231223 RepID=A0AAE0XND0_9GAST|nr:hypothetical protein RRG08_060719 [Elysia crispata]
MTQVPSSVKADGGFRKFRIQIYEDFANLTGESDNPLPCAVRRWAERARSISFRRMCSTCTRDTLHRSTNAWKVYLLLMTKSDGSSCEL